ncbi:MAG: hypothetical protein C1O27_000234 [Chloroflexi bacterium]|jgi:hypothetical protein|nr:MAG: hypothetical protein C1O27_000234 [Chloroflexota bacterium]
MPSLKNIVVKPNALVLEDQRLPGQDKRRAVVKVEGLVCNTICVQRILASLSTQTTVTEVSHNATDDTFLVEYEGPQAEGGTLAAAAMAPVVAPWLRGALEMGWKRLSRRRR